MKLESESEGAEIIHLLSAEGGRTPLPDSPTVGGIGVHSRRAHSVCHGRGDGEQWSFELGSLHCGVNRGARADPGPQTGNHYLTCQHARLYGKTKIGVAIAHASSCSQRALRPPTDA